MTGVIGYSQQMFNEDVFNLVEQIKQSGRNYALVVGLARGGLIPAVTLSHRLNVPMEALMWQTRSGGEKERKQTIDYVLQTGGRILIVDDLIDSGTAIRELLQDWGVDRSEADIAVLYTNTAQPTQPDFCARTIDRTVDQRWIVFWWEQ